MGAPVWGGVLFVPGIGPVAVAGPLVSWIVAALEGAVVVGGLSALGAGLFSMGIPKDSIIKYETELKAEKFLLIAHGNVEEIKKAQHVLEKTSAEEVRLHTSNQAAE